MEEIKKIINNLQKNTPALPKKNNVQEKNLNNSNNLKNDIENQIIDKRITFNVSSLENTFENFKRNIGTEESLNKFKIYAEGNLGTPFLVCIGGYGCGKTHLLEALVIKRNEMGYFCRVIKFNKVIENLKGSIGSYTIPSYEQILSAHCFAKNLFLDDVGMGTKETPWLISVLENIVDTRYHNRLETVMTMNKEAWTNLPPRVKSRLMDSEVCTIVENTGKDYRGIK